MTPPSKNPNSVKFVLILVVLVVSVVMWCYLSGAIYMHMIGQDYNDATPITYLQYWHYYGEIAAVKKKLNLSGFLAVLPFVIIGALFLKQKRRALHGDARFATKREILKAGLLGDHGLIVGQFGPLYLLFNGQEHVLMCAPTRSGKGVGIVIPNLLNWRDSVVVLDTKQENYDLTSKFRQIVLKQDCYLFNPAPRDLRTHRYNALAYVSDDINFRINDIQKIAGFLFPDVEGEDPIWTASSRSLFLGIVLYLFETPGEIVTIGNVLRQTTSHGDTRKHFLKVIEQRQESDNPLSAECVSSLNDFLGAPTNTRESIRKTFTSRLELWFNPVIDAATSANDFDLRDVRKRRMSIYVGVTPDDLGRMKPLLNLFFQQLIDLNIQELPSRNKALKYQCLLLMDEFAAIGKINALVSSIQYIAGYGLRMMPIIHSPAQLRDIYGDNAAETFSTNHALHIHFAPRESKVAEEISKMLGDQTWKVSSHSKPEAFGGGKGNKSSNTSDQRRALLLPQEVKEIGKESEIVSLENIKPILCSKVMYYADEKFLSRMRAVSPTLKAMGNKKPTKDQLEEIMRDGELQAPCPTLKVTRNLSIVRAAANDSKDGDENEAEETTRPITAADAGKIASMRPEDFSCDFSDVTITAATEHEMNATVDELLARFGMAA